MERDIPERDSCLGLFVNRLIRIFFEASDDIGFLQLMQDAGHGVVQTDLATLNALEGCDRGHELAARGEDER
jgi:hypothetical protein